MSDVPAAPGSFADTETRPAVEAAPRAVAGAPPGFTGYTTPGFGATAAGRLFRRAFRVSSSLQLAISLLSFFTVCLAVATFLESAYGGRVAQDLVYHTWWFAGLLVLLAVNVLCAALKKYPWKRHQIGFLITHAGLLVLIFGGLLTNLGGVEGQMMMIDSDNREVQQAFRMSNKSDTLQLVNQHQVEVLRVPKHEAKKDEQFLRAIFGVVQGGVELSGDLKARLKNDHWTMSLRPGSFAWRADEHFRPQLPWGVRFLAGVANPFPGFSKQLDDRTSLTVENYYPHTQRWPFSPGGPKDDETFPAVYLRLTTPMMPRPVKRWVTSMPAFEQDPSPIGFELFVLDDPALVPEFVEPPPDKELGREGQLVLVVGYRRTVCRLSLDKIREGETVDLEGTALKLKLKRRGNLMDLLGQKPDEDARMHHVPLYPTVEFELSGPGGKGTYMACARLPNMPTFREGQDVDRVSAWYHYPDFRWGERHRLGSLQLLKAPNGKAYYRVYGQSGLKQKAKAFDPADRSASHALPLKPMDMKFEVLAWLPSAVRREHVRPVHVRPGAEPSERFEPALRCTLTSDGESKEFWVRMGPTPAHVVAGQEIFFVRYRQDVRPVDFALTLKKAQQVSDPGTNRPAAFQSDVVLSYEQGGDQVRKDYRVSMNHTLDHGGYKVYQTNYRPLTNPQTGELLVDGEGRLVSLSGLTVADDPGLFCKYAGSVLLVLGIGTMFYMRAYFFKPRPRAGSGAA